MLFYNISDIFYEIQKLYCHSLYTRWCTFEQNAGIMLVQCLCKNSILYIAVTCKHML